MNANNKVQGDRVLKCVINAELYPCNGKITCDLPSHISYNLSTPSLPPANEVWAK